MELERGREGILEKVTLGLRGVRQKNGGAQGENILGRERCKGISPFPSPHSSFFLQPRKAAPREGKKDLKPDCVLAYPITPQSHSLLSVDFHLLTSSQGWPRERTGCNMQRSFGNCSAWGWAGVYAPSIKTLLTHPHAWQPGWPVKATLQGLGDLCLMSPKSFLWI